MTETSPSISPRGMPRDEDWNRFWSRNFSARPDAVSWSKRRIIRIIDEYAAPGKKALDAGCGSGFFSRHFCGRGMTTTAMDYADAALDITKAMTQGRARVVKADLLAEGLAGRVQDRFDLIFTDGLFEHFSASQQDQIFRNLKSLLNSGGVIITFVPNRWSPWELIRPFFMPGIQETPFVMSQLLDLNQRNAMTVLRAGGVNTFPFAFSPDRLLGPRFGMLLFSVSQ
ncbi:MAG: class I SAM-dependent methyltransferase [Candidatus Omnitrophota bacterium]|nr:class I SAM-dependent methyltransferase [Candidatus Omnitrophota bacterium]MDZ4242727.1 class I SAM-dependent methyltransferase [Candidatus Omnitrophota bacterium]